MLNEFKAPVIPTVILLGELVLAKWTPEWLVGLLIGFTLFWLLLSLITAGNIVKRYPWLREWAPFLDPTGGAISQADLRSNYVRGKTFPLWEVAVNGIVSDKTFEDCVITGPAVMAAMGHTTCRFPRWVTQGDFWFQLERAADGNGVPKDGVIAVENCTFNRCTFRNIGVAGPDREAFMGALQHVPPPAAA